MKITIDDTTFYTDMGKVARTLKVKYATIKDAPIKLSSGKIIDLTRKSIARLAVKAFMVQTILPMVEDMYASQQLDMPVHIKHEDLIDYIVNAILDFMEKIEGKVHTYVVTDKSLDDAIRNVKSISTTRKNIPEMGLRPGNGEHSTTSTNKENENSRGTAHIRSGQNGNGKDEINQRDYTQEVTGTTIS